MGYAKEQGNRENRHTFVEAMEDDGAPRMSTAIGIDLDGDGKADVHGIDLDGDGQADVIVPSAKPNNDGGLSADEVAMVAKMMQRLEGIEGRIGGLETKIGPVSSFTAAS